MDEERGRHRVDRYFGATRDPGSSRHSGRSIRERVRKAAFAVFCERGFSGASMLEIATRAQVSKRDLYACLEVRISEDRRARNKGGALYGTEKQSRSFANATGPE